MASTVAEVFEAVGVFVCVCLSVLFFYFCYLCVCHVVVFRVVQYGVVWCSVVQCGVAGRGFK